MQQFRLRYRAHDIALAPGEFVIGRSEECQLSLDDAMISRRHAVLRVSSSSVILADLGSRNGVSVNGEKIKSEHKLQDGDRISIGSHHLQLLVVAPDSSRVRTPLARTLGPVELEKLDAVVHGAPPYTPTTGIARALGSFSTLAHLADKTLALGRPEEAERLLSGPLNDFLAELRRGATVDPSVLGRLATYAMKLATELSKSTWADWILEAYMRAGHMLPAPIVDALLVLGPKLKHFNRAAIRDYVDTMHAMPNLTPNDRFLLKRIESLVRRLATLP